MARIVLIEDDEIYSYYLKEKLLNTYPFETFEFYTNGVDGVNAVTSETLIGIIDFMLENELGLDVIKEMKLKNPNMEFILLTSTPFEDVELIAKKIGVFDFIKKGNDDYTNLKHNLNVILSIDKLRKEFDDKLLLNGKNTKKGK